MKSAIKELSLFLEQLTYGTEYIFLEEGKDAKELEEVGKKCGLKLPSKDLSVFKAIYAFIDEENKNGCTLPLEEVDESLPTLVGKAIDLDHFRKRTIGYWLLSERDGKKIVAYGAIWKNNFAEEFDDIKSLMQEGKLKVSFEAWGDRVYKGTGKKNYDLTNIEWAGGALLLTTQPAFTNAKVLELAREMKTPDTFVYERGTDLMELELEESRFHFYDYEIIGRLIYEAKCPSCQKQGSYEVDLIDFQNSKVQVHCISCDSKYDVHLEPDTTLTKKGKKIKSIDEVKATIDKSSNTKTIEKVDTELENKAIKEKEGGNNIVDKLLKKYSKSTAEELASFLDAELESIKTSLSEKDKEIATLKDESGKKDATIVLKDEEIATLKKDFDVVKATLKSKEDAERNALIQSRKEKLGDFAKDMKDEDILDDLKFENATLRKLIAEKNPEVAKELEIGQKNKNTDNSIFEKQERVKNKAFPK